MSHKERKIEGKVQLIRNLRKARRPREEAGGLYPLPLFFLPTLKGVAHVRGNPIDNGQFKSILFLFFQRGRKGFLQQQDSRLCLTSLYSASSRVADKKCPQCRTRGDLLNTFATSSLSFYILIVNEWGSFLRWALDSLSQFCWPIPRPRKLSKGWYKMIKIIFPCPCFINHRFIWISNDFFTSKCSP